MPHVAQLRYLTLFAVSPDSRIESLRRYCLDRCAKCHDGELAGPRMTTLAPGEPICVRPETVSWDAAQQAEWEENFAVAWSMFDTLTQAIPGPTGVPAWNGQPLKSTDVLYVWKQIRDIGADIRHASMFIDLQRLSGTRVVVETDPRLIRLFERSFPKISYVPRDPAAHSTRFATHHVTHERLGMIFRSQASDFPSQPGFLIPDPQRAAWAHGLRPHDGRPLIGFSWTSTNRAKSLPTLQEWLPVLRGIPAAFVSLQYGEMDRDIDFLRRNGVEIEQVPGLDLWDDFDGQVSVLAACDAVFTISNTTAHLAGAIGTPTVVVLRDAPMLSWPRMRGRTAWYPAVRLEWCPATMPWQDWMTAHGNEFEMLARAA